MSDFVNNDTELNKKKQEHCIHVWVRTSPNLCPAQSCDGACGAWQSAPTPDLLLTDEEIMGAYDELFENEPKAVFKLSKYGIIFARKIEQTVLSKLQQARTQTGEQDTKALAKKIAHAIYKYWEDVFVPEDYIDCEALADQILSLLPDEQAIRKEERKAIGEWLEKHMELSRGGNSDDWQDLLVALQSGERPGGEK